MKLTRYVTVKIEYENKEVWEKSLKDIHDLINMMNNITRQATITKISKEVKK